MHRLFTQRFNYLINSLKINRHFSAKMSKSALVILPNGAEEMEFVIAVDVLRRSNIMVTVSGLNGKLPVTCSRDVVIVPDVSLEDSSDEFFDCIVLPGGLGGANAMSQSKELGDLLKKYEDHGKLIAAICAAPTVLLAHSIGFGKSLTSYPGFKQQLSEKYNYLEDNVVHDGNLLTSRGPGTAFVFALKIAEILVGAEKSKEVAKGMLLH